MKVTLKREKEKKDISYIAAALLGSETQQTP